MNAPASRNAPARIGLDRLIEKFNDRQREAVTMPLESCLVLAGAGSGKTAVLTARIGCVTERMNVLPERVLAVTFTNKAAEEMRKRLRRVVGDEAVSKMWIGTFHSLCNRILRQEHESAQLPRGFAILDTDGQERMIRQILRDREADRKKDDSEERAKPAPYLKGINEAKEAQRKPYDIDEDMEGLPEGFVDVFVEYNQICRAQGLLDFNDLQTRTLELFEQSPEVLSAFKHKFQTIFVDEFQDTNEVQYQWLRHLTGPQTCVMAVGDDDQSIYGFRGAQPENMQRFLNEFARGRKIALEQNYRSLPFVLDAANAVIRNNRSRLGKNLFTEQADRAERISNVTCENEFEEAKFIAGQIKALLARGARPSEIAVLYRTNTQSRLFEHEMLKVSVPVTVYGGYRFYDRQEIRHLFAYLDLACNVTRDVSFARVVNFPPRGLGERTVEALRLQAKEAGQSMMEQVMINAQINESPDKKQLALEDFADLICTMGEQAQRLSLKEFVETALHDSRLEDHYMDMCVSTKKKKKTKSAKEEEDEGALKLENLYAARDNAAQFEAEFIAVREKAGDKAPAGGWKAAHILPDYLAEIALLTSTSEADMSKKNTVSLMTVHASKGLEFDHVFIAGLEENIFPHKRSLPDPEAEPGCTDSLYLQQLASLEEERRLMYVAITRAKKTLGLSRAARRKVNGTWESTIASRFVQEIPEARIKHVGVSTRKQPYEKAPQRTPIFQRNSA